MYLVSATESRTIYLLLFAMAAFFVWLPAACTAHKQTRDESPFAGAGCTATNEHVQDATCELKIVEREVPADERGRSDATAVIERWHYPKSADYWGQKCLNARPDSRPGEDRTPEIVRSDKCNDYYLAFIEFDDQGWFWDRRQLEALMQLLYDGNPQDPDTGKDAEYLLFVFAHGWKHNSGGCDTNVLCFQRTLERLDLLERQQFHEAHPHFYRGKPRKVIGIYVGWRGLSISSDWLSNLSFWRRKGIAERIGEGGVIELLTRLNEFYQFKTPDRERKVYVVPTTQLLVFGHSFGGQIVYSALASHLVEGALRIGRGHSGAPEDTRYGDGQVVYQPAEGFGNLVVLLNPALEGSIYETLHHVATNRCYPDTQTPVMLIATSKEDGATRFAFPLGRWFSTFLDAERIDEPEQLSLTRYAVGHLRRYKTHELELADGKYDWPKVEVGKCRCPFLSTRKFRLPAAPSWLERPSFNHDEGSEWYSYGEYKSDALVTDGDRGATILLRRVRDFAVNYPYWVVEVDHNMIRDHNSVFGEPFVDFLRRFYQLHVAVKWPFMAANKEDLCTVTPNCRENDIIPCEQSCTRGYGQSCSGRKPIGPLKGVTRQF